MPSGLDESLGTVHGEGIEANELIRSLEQIEVAADGSGRNAGIPTPFRLVDYGANAKRRDSHQPAKIGAVGDRCQVWEVTIEIGVDVPLVPRGAILVRPEIEGWRRVAAQSRN